MITSEWEKVKVIKKEIAAQTDFLLFTQIV